MSTGMVLQQHARPLQTRTRAPELTSSGLTCVLGLEAPSKPCLVRVPRQRKTIWPKANTTARNAEDVLEMRRAR